METFLRRAKGCKPDILALYNHNFVPTWGLPSLYTKNIESLQFKCNIWADVEEIEQITSEQAFPLLHSLTIAEAGRNRDMEVLDLVRRTRPLSSRLFNNANLKEFCFHSGEQLAPLLSYFAFPKLVSFHFSATLNREFHIMELLKFLKASPMLEKLHIEFPARTYFWITSPQGEFATLPNVKKLTLVSRVSTDSHFGYQLAGHRSSIMPFHDTHGIRAQERIWDRFGGESDSWDTIVSQRCKKEPIEEVTLQLTPSDPITCELGFRSPDGAVVEFRFEEDDNIDNREPSKTIYISLFQYAIWFLKRHPQLKSVKRLDICHGLPSDGSAEELLKFILSCIQSLFRCLDPLDELTVSDCDPAPYIFNYGRGELQTFPQTKTLRISDPINFNRKTYRAILDLIILQHKLQKPFHEVFIRVKGMAEDVKRWPIDPSLDLPDVTMLYVYDG